MRRFKGVISTDVTGSGRGFEFEVEDGATEEEIEEAAIEAAFQYVNWYYSEIRS